MAGRGFVLRLSSFFSTPRLLTQRIQINPQPQWCALNQSSRELLDAANLPEKPKRPLTSYLRFAADRRAELRRENPQLKMTEVTRKCAEEWRGATPIVREKYEAISKKELEEYARKHLNYVNSLSEQQKEVLKTVAKQERKTKAARRKKRKSRKLHKPKKPTGPFMLFALEQKTKRNYTKPYPELLKEMKDPWRNLSDSERSKYEFAFQEKKKLYDIELSVWEKRMIEEGNFDVVRKKTLEDKNLADLERELSTDKPSAKSVEPKKSVPRTKKPSSGAKKPE